MRYPQYPTTTPLRLDEVKTNDDQREITAGRNHPMGPQTARNSGVSSALLIASKFLKGRRSHQQSRQPVGFLGCERSVVEYASE